MAINVNTANDQAGQLNNNISQLRSAKKQMLAYKSSVSNSWQGKEVGKIVDSAADKAKGWFSDVGDALSSGWKSLGSVFG